MKTRVDAEAFVRCARKIEALGAATQGAPPTADVLARAALLTAHLHDNFLTLCSGTEEGGGLAQGPTTAFADADAFCGALRGVRFVPSHAASALAGPHEGEPLLACFGELALHQDRRLLWTVAPVLRREWAPPRELWPALGLLHPPPMENVLAHAAQLAAWAPDAWPFDGVAEPLREVVGALWAYFAERQHAASAEAMARLAQLPLVLCGAALVRPSRVFGSCFGACQPLLQPRAAISSRPQPSDALLVALGMGEAAALPDYLRLLRELPDEYRGARLAPSERRAVLATLQLAADAPGFRADGRLALPTADGGLAPLRSCVVDDAPWLLHRMRPGAVRLVSAVGTLLQAQLGPWP